MFLDGGDQIREWLEGHFPILEWRLVHTPDKFLIVEGWFIWREHGLPSGMTNVLSFTCGPNAHTEWLDMTIEHILDRPNMNWNNLPDGWKGEYVEYRSPHPVL